MKRVEFVLVSLGNKNILTDEKQMFICKCVSQQIFLRINKISSFSADCGDPKSTASKQRVHQDFFQQVKI